MKSNKNRPNDGARFLWREQRLWDLEKQIASVAGAWTNYAEVHSNFQRVIARTSWSGPTAALIREHHLLDRQVQPVAGQIKGFFMKWAEQFGANEVDVRDLAPMAKQFPKLPLDSEYGENLGQFIKFVRDRVFGGWVVVCPTLGAEGMVTRLKPVAEVQR